MTMLRTAFSVASPGGKRGRLTTFIFHRVLPEIDPLFPDEPDVHRFSEMLGWISAWFNVLPLTVAIDCQKKGKLPPRAAAITFDDGYADNFTLARPILQQHGMCATFFIATSFLDGGRMWNDTVIEALRRTPESVLDLSPHALGQYEISSVATRRAAIHNIIGKIKYLPVAERTHITERIAEIAGTRLPDSLMMTSAQVIGMRQSGMQIGAHTLTHPILARLDKESALSEITGSKQILENILGEEVPVFAYPNGKPGEDYQPEHATMVRESGFTAAVSTAWGAADSGSDYYQLPRFTPWDKSRLRFGVRLLSNLRHNGRNA